MTVFPRRVLTGAGLLATAFAIAACGDSSTAPGGEQEIISRVTITLTPASGAPLVSYIDDPDGNGPQAPAAQVGALTLTAGATYTGTVKFENRLATPPVDITEEVEEEANEHRVYYTVSTFGSSITVTTLDTDPAGRPLGLQYRVVAGPTTGPGALRVVLCHYDDAPKVASSTSCQGDTDIDVVFNYTITN
jgi:hypothetical protein